MVGPVVCVECQTSIDKDDAFCRSCGAAQETQSVAPTPVTSRKVKWRTAGGRGLHDLAGRSVDEIVAYLGSNPVVISVFQQVGARGPGVYAIFGSSEVWVELGLGAPPDSRPLYVGKHETDAARRLTREHFAFGYTNVRRPVTSISSFRRSLAGLLRDSWGIRGIPRYPGKASLSTADLNGFGLATPEQEERLTGWMRGNLSVTAWIPDPESVPEEERVRIVEPLEKEIEEVLRPACNVDKGDPITEWTVAVAAGRKAMRGDARRWSEKHRP